jgi:integrase
LLAFRHALRVSELVNVKVEQIDLKAATIHIRRAKNGMPGIHGLQGDKLLPIRALLREPGESACQALTFTVDGHRGSRRARWCSRTTFVRVCAISGQHRLGRAKATESPRLMRRWQGLELP